MNHSDLPQKKNDVDPAKWVEDYGDYLFRFALSRLRNTDAAEEVVQETMVSALKNIKQYAGQSTERTWLTGILKLKIIDRFRELYRTNVKSENAIEDKLFDQKGRWKQEVRSAMRCSVESLDRDDFWKIFEHCLAELSEKQAAVFTMRVIDMLQSEDICKELAITSANYWVLLHRARLQLSSCMKQRWFQEGNDEPC